LYKLEIRNFYLLETKTQEIRYIGLGVGIIPKNIRYLGLGVGLGIAPTPKPNT
jgi:hypothetical protein